MPDFSAVADQVADAARPGDVVVTMGAGDVTMLGQEILASLQVQANRERTGPVRRRRSDRAEAGAAATSRPRGDPPRRDRRLADDGRVGDDFEGPRRRARREREERRAAQARATAIEQARREAKRRVAGRARGRRRNRWPAARFGA